jgi:ferric-dicitrate binding protein FerR (iron transport regulator)
MVAPDKAKELLRRYLQGNCTESEKAMIEAWYLERVRDVSSDAVIADERETGERMLAELRRRLHFGEPDERNDAFVNDPAAGSPVVNMRPRRRWMPYAAACVLLLISTGIAVWWLQGHQNKAPEIAVRKFDDIAPGGSKATLTLANGQKIDLDSTATGLIARQGNTAIVQPTSGKLEFQSSAGKAVPSTGIVYNSLSTPAGGQYQVVLPDGSKVWLNALTTIRFPTLFTGARREVQVNGEAYFEVAKDESHPFIVKARDIGIEVLGTAFNINDYEDEPAIRTSLVQGSVRLVRGSASLVLKHGEQAQTEGADNLSIVPDADVIKAIAWKNGSFSFDNDKIQTVMRKLAKWYNIDVRYEGDPTKVLFGGNMRRTLSLQQVLSGLSKYDVHFQLSGRTLVVMP